MDILRTRSFERDFVKLPSMVRERFFEKLKFFLQDSSYPSLQAKKMQGKISVWEARITRGYRFTFEQRRETVILRRIGTHDILRNP